MAPVSGQGEAMVADKHKKGVVHSAVVSADRVFHKSEKRQICLCQTQLEEGDNRGWDRNFGM
ncbi:hypothetical protein E5D57_006280 [Metarhizium anisopliae]|nr:hypothetical protein E5D57_006280 [Metarhizium anisopliae]